MNIKPNKDGTLEDLPLRAKFENALMFWARPYTSPLVASACVQWFVNTWRANKAGRPQMPVTIDIFNYLIGESCAGIRDRLQQYGISTQLLTLEFELWPDKKGVGLRCIFWVPRSQAAMADDILRQHQGCYLVNSPRLGKGYKYGQPWGVPAKARSWDEAVCQVMFGLMANRSSVLVGKSEKPQALAKTDASRPSPTVKRRKSAKKVSTVAKIAKGIWDA